MIELVLVVVVVLPNNVNDSSYVSSNINSISNSSSSKCSINSSMSSCSICIRSNSISSSVKICHEKVLETDTLELLLALFSYEKFQKRNYKASYQWKNLRMTFQNNL